MPDINRAYTWAVQTCAAPNVGYSTGYRNQQTVDGVTYYDCSSFVWYALKAGGFENLGSYPFYTSNMLSVLPAAGFRQVPITGKWLAGDILHRYAGQFPDPLDSGHTEMVYQSGESNGQGRAMGAHWYVSANYPTLQDTVSIDNYIATYQMYTSLWRYGSGADEDEDAYFEGSTMYTVAAMCAVWNWFSKMNPDFQGEVQLLDPDSLCYGMPAWYGQRKLDWLDYAGLEFRSGEKQMDYFIQENYWNSADSDYASLTDYLNSLSTDYRELIINFLAGFYDITVTTSDLTVLVSYAEAYHDYISDHAQDTNIQYWLSNPSGDLSALERMNNVVMVFRYLSAGGGGGGTPTVLKRRTPIWMYIRYRNIKK